MRWNLISMRRVIFRWLNLVVEYINADEKIHFCLYLMNKMRTNFINAIMQVLFPVAFIVLHYFFSSSGSLILDAQFVSTKAKLALSSFLLLTILPSYFSTFLVSLHNHLYHISIVLSPTPLPPPHLYCFPMLLYHHHICIVFPLATTTTTFVLFSHPPLQPPYLYRFPIHHYNHHICSCPIHPHHISIVCPQQTEPHTHKIWSTSFRLVVTWLTERTYVRVYRL